MYIGSHYSLREFLYWTRRDIYFLIIVAIVPTVAFHIFKCYWLAIPWVPVALVGTASAFLVGFKNTQTYNRLWEARQIWGAIVNTSRSFAMLVKDNVQTGKTVHQQLFYRHCAWLTAVRFQLREKRTWENSDKPYNKEYRRFYKVPEWENSLEEELKQYLSIEELQYIIGKKNRATQLISLQSKQLAALKAEGKIDPLLFTEIENQLISLYEQQGKCERTKNFPYPKQFASINLFFVWLLVILLPFGMLNEFKKMGEDFIWLNIPFSVIVSWVFVSMERVGEATENPFEGGANDVPISTLSRTIEIDLRDMLDETNLPAPLTATHNIQM
ncbi:MAG TPA: bestrophin family ion channel [Ferruginibacter sp.]|nr:bestrophin family ion channel [Ferruginibacter sp.]HPH93141.1 bestrophin family ion channel [Ferruginibacter sp.]